MKDGYQALYTVHCVLTSDWSISDSLEDTLCRAVNNHRCYQQISLFDECQKTVENLKCSV